MALSGGMRLIAVICIQVQGAGGAGRPGRGRPKGQPAWNKGKPMSATAKQHLSQSQKARWKKKPALRAAVSSKLKVTFSSVFCLLTPT